jgi:hypothetical protein
MTRITKTINQLEFNTAFDSAATGVYTTIDASLVSAGLSITDFFKHKLDYTFIHVKNTAASSKNITFKAGVQFRSGIGDLVVSVPNSGERMVQLESARFKQADGALYVDFDSGFTGSIGGFSLR